MIDPSEQLVARAREGSRAAGTELVELHYEAVFAYFRRSQASDADAADLTQRTFIKAWAALPGFQGRSRFSTWIHGIAHHLLIDSWRRRDPVQAAPDDWWDSRASEGPGPFEHAVQRDQARVLWSWVARLEPDRRETVLLHYCQGLSIEETAQVLQIATSTVKYRLREAVEFLRARMEEPAALAESGAPARPASGS